MSYWLFTKAKGGNKSPQCYLTASEINTTEHNAQLHLGLLDCLGVLDLLVSTINIRKNYPVLCIITEAMRNVSVWLLRACQKLIKHNLFYHCWFAILFPPPNRDNTHEIKSNFSLLTMSWGNTERFRSKLCRPSCVNCQKNKFQEQSVVLRWICIASNKGSYLNKKSLAVWVSVIFMIIISFISIKGSPTWPPWNQLSFLQTHFKIILSKTHL